MPSVTKSRTQTSKSSSKSKKSAKPVKNGHGNGIRAAAAKLLKVAVKKVKSVEKTAAKAVSKAVSKGGSKTSAKRVYFFGGTKADGNKEMKNLLGGKGANLAEMANIGLPVPPGFTITTEVCTEFYAGGKKLPKGLDADIRSMVARMEKLVGAKFGDHENPLLVSVRSGARASMPGMMDTILNLGLNDATVTALAAESGDARFAHDSYRRFIQMYSSVVLGIEHHLFEDALEEVKSRRGYQQDTDLSAEEW